MIAYTPVSRMYLKRKHYSASWDSFLRDQPVHIEHGPHPNTAALCLVKFLEGVESKETATDDEEGVDAKKPVPDSNKGKPGGFHLVRSG